MKTTEAEQGEVLQPRSVHEPSRYNVNSFGDFLRASRASRLDADAEGNQRGIVYHTIKTLIEMIPGGIGPYGIGDAISFFEGIRGKEILGRKLDRIDRLISIIAALIPLVPATPFREAVRNFRIQIEETAAKNNNRQ